MRPTHNPRKPPSDAYRHARRARSRAERWSVVADRASALGAEDIAAVARRRIAHEEALVAFSDVRAEFLELGRDVPSSHPALQTRRHTLAAMTEAEAHLSLPEAEAALGIPRRTETR